MESPRAITTLKDEPRANASWLVEAGDGTRVVLRRYHDEATPEDLAYEHAVLAHLSRQGWVVPSPLSELVPHGGRFYCLTRYVPGRAIRDESAAQRRQRGRDLARLHVALRGLEHALGQRPGWRPQHTAVTVHRDVDWSSCVDALAEVDAALAAWCARAAEDTHAALAAIGADALPTMIIHGDFAKWNVHYDDDQLAGVIDFGLTHLDSRPYELAIARTYRSPETIAGYRQELADHDWPLSELEEAAIVPMARAFRVDMAAWFIYDGRRTGVYDLEVIERQLARTGTPPPA